jgi:cell pole-organizing protein PopZ
MGDVNQDPSMEEILASIKRVIADDSRAGPAPRGRGKAAAVSEASPSAQPDQASADADDDVLELSNPLPDDGLISSNVTVATRNSFATLASLRQQVVQSVESVPVGEGPLEAVVREMLRPMLKEWLDTRLPEMVEDMVSREIARITGKTL